MLGTLLGTRALAQAQLATAARSACRLRSTENLRLHLLRVCCEPYACIDGPCIMGL